MLDAAYSLLDSLEKTALSAGVPAPAFNLLRMTIVLTLVFAFVLLTTIILIYVERKTWAYMQVRLGPMRVGPKGALQTVADGIKLFLKEDVIPALADKPLFRAAPVIVLVPALMAYVVIPFGDGLIAKDLNIGILYILSISSVGVLGIITSGWSSNNKYSLLGGMRAAAQIVSYEVPVLLSILGVVMLTGSLSMNAIVESQKAGLLGGWYFFRPPFNQTLAGMIYLTAALAELNRTPFDLPEAESELVAGYNTEYSGMRFAFFFLAEWMNMFLLACIAATLFFGGWLAPFGLEFAGRLGSLFWFLLKVWALMFVVIWIRATFPRFRVDQLMEFSWKFLIPLTLANVIVTAVIIAAR
ncbi:MAG: NADH-quinone oxidoreductase subunit NuoH [bacterium]